MTFRTNIDGLRARVKQGPYGRFLHRREYGRHTISFSRFDFIMGIR